MSNVRDQSKNRDSRLLKNYFQDLKKCNPVSRKEENKLIKRVQQGDERAKAHLILANLRFVVAIAKKYRYINDTPFEELISVGNLGLMRAAKRFDSERNVRFISYAVWWIRQAMIQVVSTHGSPIRLPLNRVHTSLKIKRVQETLQKKLNRTPTLEELANAVMMKTEDLSKFMQFLPTGVSIDSTPVDAEEELFLRDVLTDFESDPLLEAEKNSLENELAILLESLTEREQIVLRHRFGFHDAKTRTLEEIGKLLGVTRERVRQIESQALTKLRNPRKSGELQNYLY